jgi:hypothetical protein
MSVEKIDDMADFSLPVVSRRIDPLSLVPQQKHKGNTEEQATGHRPPEQHAVERGDRFSSVRTTSERSTTSVANSATWPPAWRKLCSRSADTS